MLVRRIVDDRLAQVCYLVGCQDRGEAIVIDPPRLIGPVLDAAREEKLRISYVTETHIHADFLSGARELVQVTGAKALLSAEGGPGWQYHWGEAVGARMLHDGDIINIGKIHMAVRHTPGHTPEHLSFVVTDTARSEVPLGMLSGDFLFVGDVGRPDLLERAAHVAGSMEQSAKQLFQSIQSLKDLPDHLQVWPGHGAGSSCGKALGSMPSSTLGYERLTNWAFGVEDEATFVKAVLEGQPAPPTYFATMKRMNKEGAPILETLKPLVQLDSANLLGALSDTTLIDTRSVKAFAAEHVNGSLVNPIAKAFPTWAGWFASYERPITLIVDDAAAAARAQAALASIGLDNVAGYFTPDVLLVARAHGLVRSLRQEDVLDAPAMAKEGRKVIDVRAQSEWDAGHIPGAEHHFLGTLEQSLQAMDRDTPVALHCQGGSRGGIGASVLEKMGFTDVIELPGGYGMWEKR